MEQTKMNKQLLKYLPMQKLIDGVAPRLLDGVCTMLSMDSPPSFLFESSWANVDPESYLSAVKVIGEHAEHWKGQPNSVISRTTINRLKNQYKISDRLYNGYFQLSLKDKNIIRILANAPVSEGVTNNTLGIDDLDLSDI